jgi:hypothetical protein
MWRRIVVATFSLIAIIATALVLGVLCGPWAYAGVVPDDEWDDETKLWLARSVLGEAGWRQHAEYTAVAYVYAVRAEQTERYDFLGMVKRYSAAVRAPGRAKAPWRFELGFDKTRPRSWPSGPLWKGRYDQEWLDVLDWADRWQAGEYANPCEGANHFGGYGDSARAEWAGWTRIKCKVRMRNRFYTSLKLRRRKAR